MAPARLILPLVSSWDNERLEPPSGQEEEEPVACLAPRREGQWSINSGSRSNVTSMDIWNAMD